MAIVKFDKRLTEEIAKRKEEIKVRKIVAIEHSQRVAVPKEGSKKEMIENLKERASKLQRPVAEKLVSMGVNQGKIKQQWISNALSAELTIEQIEKIAELDDVKIIRLEKPDKVTCLNGSVPLINAPQVWNMGYTGSGVNVAVLDTGIDRNHPALAGKVVDEFDTSGEGIGTPGNHGTHVAGIIASNDNTYRGVKAERFSISR
ncbi:MAG: S8 family serine peptidase [Candidatus Syntrophoarchaeum sp.]|nr:S8 family serine peptidase [Candidatus Syntrophoarchaeum sp.]